MDLSTRIATRFLLAKGYFDIGTIVLYGKYKNHHGKIVGFSQDHWGNPQIEVEPIPKGRKQNKVIGLYKIWRADVKEKALADEQAKLAQRIVARYKAATSPVAMEFDTPEAMQKYLHEHPGADPANHSVKKHDKASPGGGDKKPEPKKTFTERLKSMSSKAHDFVKNAPATVQKFIHDDAFRRETLTKMSEHVANLPEKTLAHVKHAIKHEAKEFQTAYHGVKAVLKGGKMTPEQKHAFKEVCFDAAVAVALTAVTGGLGGGAAGAVGSAAHHFASSIAKKIALNAVTHGLGNLVKVQELAHLGHGVFEHVLEAVTAAEKQTQGDDKDLLAAYVTKLVQNELKNLDPDTLAEAIEGAAGV